MKRAIQVVHRHHHPHPGPGHLAHQIEMGGLVQGEEPGRPLGLEGEEKGGLRSAQGQVEHLERAVKLTGNHESALAGGGLCPPPALGDKTPAPSAKQRLQRVQLGGIVIDEEFFLHQRRIAMDEAQPLAKRPPAGVADAFADAVTAFLMHRFLELHTVPDHVAKPAKPVIALVAIDVAAEDVEPQRLNHFQLRAAMSDRGRQRAMIAGVGEPLPVVGGVGETRRGAPLQNRGEDGAPLRLRRNRILRDGGYDFAVQ